MTVTSSTKFSKKTQYGINKKKREKVVQVQPGGMVTAKKQQQKNTPMKKLNVQTSPYPMEKGGKLNFRFSFFFFWMCCYGCRRGGSGGERDDQIICMEIVLRGVTCQRQLDCSSKSIRGCVALQSWLTYARLACLYQCAHCR